MCYVICEGGWGLCYEMSWRRGGEGDKKMSNLRYVINEWPLIRTALYFKIALAVQSVIQSN